MVPGVTFFGSAVQAAEVVAVALDVLVGNAASEGQVRGDRPHVLGPDFLCRGDGVLMAALDGGAIFVGELVAAVVIAPDIIRRAVFGDADKRLGLALAGAFVPVADIDAVCFVEIPLQFGGHARAPALCP